MKRRKGLSKPQQSGMQKFFLYAFQAFFLAGFLGMLVGMLYLAREAGILFRSSPL